MGDGLMPTITLPVVGTVERKWVWVGAATVAGLVAWSYWRKRSSTPVTVDEGVDGAPDAFVADGGASNVPGATGNATVTGANPEVIDTVSEWTADVVAKLSGAQWDVGYIYTTLGKWIAGETLNDPEKALVQAAVAAAGEPPGGPYPIKTALPTPTPTPTPAPVVPASVSVPLNVNLYDWTYQISQAYHIPYDLNIMRNLNPGISDYIKWLDTKPDKTPIFWKGTPPVRLR
jgi:hypothetical protein